MPTYKGRVVFRGDNVKDDEGALAVFSEQGTSASHQAAGKMLDAIARFQDCDGSDADAIGAYHQVVMSEVPGYEHVEIWVTLPRHRRPASWDRFEDPVCLLGRNLYGHPLAGLFLELHNTKILLEEGTERY